MKKDSKTYTFFQKISSIFLMATLVWLTISAPFVSASLQELAKQQKTHSIDSSATSAEDEAADSDGNTVEEKVACNAFAEEYLHEHNIVHYLSSKTFSYHKLENADSYIAFHGELLVPPPNAA
jgi:hypothetical protein